MKKFWLKKIWEGCKNLDVFNLGNSVIAYYIFMFGALPLSIFLRVPSKFIEYINSANLTGFFFGAKTIFYLVSGLVALALGYYFSGFILKKQRIRISAWLGWEWSPRMTAIVFGIVFIGSLIIKTLQILGGAYFHLGKNPIFTSSSFYGTIAFLDLLGPISLAIAFALYFELLKAGDRRFRVWRVVAWFFFSLELLYGLFSGSRFWAIVPIAVYLIIKHYLWSRSWLRIGVAAILIFFVIMPLQTFYKTPEIFFNSYYSPAHDYPSSLGSPTVIATKQFIFDNSVGRINNTQVVSHVFANTKNFAHGKTLWDFFISLGPPRFIWKNKPLSINSQGNVFGREIGVATPDDYKTSVGPTVVGDWYINFGLGEIILGMLFLGFLYRFVFDALVNNLKPPLFGVVIYSIFWPQIMIGMEQWIAPVWAGLVKMAILLFLLYYFLTSSWRSDLSRLRFLNKYLTV